MILQKNFGFDYEESLKIKPDKDQMVLGIAVIVWAAFYCSQNWYQLMLMQGNSMDPAYHNMQLAIIDKHSEDYVYNDVIAFKCEKLDSILVKRIAACPGDSVEIKNGTLYVNGKISTIYQLEGIFEEAGIAGKKFVLQEEQYFVIGDNVAESKDSRYEEIGCVKLKDILGRLL